MFVENDNIAVIVDGAALPGCSWKALTQGFLDRALTAAISFCDRSLESCLAKLGDLQGHFARLGTFQ